MIGAVRCIRTTANAFGQSCGSPRLALPVSIATAVGYSSESAFSAAFAKTVKRKPGAYRRPEIRSWANALLKNRPAHIRLSASAASFRVNSSAGMARTSPAACPAHSCI